ncbi:hypothetical protein CPB83DRAFT_876167 [Crepidotus variabilis]|uniref:Uncharacterized protein n=1 Tax=Crepidotus variabilis TaxID=179855 RepID=A0A9P6EEI2_9AGAR|nr:hypothetical protein CPB83DRAFT_876167 [Crepidotus variabilis]
MASSKSSDSFTFTVGKLDAGMAILLGERAHLIEFPSILLPPGATTGSIVNIAVHQNHVEEKKREKEFWDLQDGILETYGQASPEPPKLSVRNVTQTSVTLEWEPIKLATAKLRSLDIYRNGERLSAVPAPTTNTSTKHSGMDIATEYTFQLILRTTAGTYPSNILRVRTHTMQDTSGICVCFGNVQDPVLLENVKLALREMGANWSDKIQIDTSHFVCTTPAATPSGASATGNASSAPGVQYQRALQLSIPVVQPYWVLACHAEKRMMPIANFYLGANSPATAHFSNRPLSMSQASLPRSPASPQPNSGKATPSSYRSSMPPPSRNPETPGSSAFINQPSSANDFQRSRQFESMAEENEEDSDLHTAKLSSTPTTDQSEKRKSRSGTMNKDFRFPSPTPTPTTPQFVTSGMPKSSGSTPPTGKRAAQERATTPPTAGVALPHSRGSSIVNPSAIEVPPPPPVEKESSMSTISLSESIDDDVGPTEEISLN